MPFTPLAGVDVNAFALQIVDTILFIAATGMTVTVTVKVAPVQPPDNGVTVYVAVPTALVVFVSVWLMFAWATACALPPVIDPTGAITGDVHVEVVPAGTMPFTPLAGADVNVFALQIVDT